MPSSLSHSVFHFLAVVNVTILCLGADDGALSLALAVTNTGSCCDNTGTGMGVVWQTGDIGVVCFLMCLTAHPMVLEKDTQANFCFSPSSVLNDYLVGSWAVSFSVNPASGDVLVVSGS